MTEHTHEIWPANRGGVVCIVPGCAMHLDANETATAFQALLAALEAVEWEDQSCWGDFCSWCNNEQAEGHKPDCQRQAAIAQAKGEE